MIYVQKKPPSFPARKIPLESLHCNKLESIRGNICFIFREAGIPSSVIFKRGCCWFSPSARILSSSHLVIAAKQPLESIQANIWFIFRQMPWRLSQTLMLRTPFPLRLPENEHKLANSHINNFIFSFFARLCFSLVDLGTTCSFDVEKHWQSLTSPLTDPLFSHLPSFLLRRLYSPAHSLHWQTLEKK